MDSKIKNFMEAMLPPENFRVVTFPNIILLCGGPAQNKDSISFRNFLKQNDILTNYLLPEDIKEWNQYDMYSDLLSFEEDLGAIISSVVLFLESAGAIAELGAFSKITSISNKLLVIVDEKYYQTDSFIKLGPIQYLENSYDKSILVCDFMGKGYQTNTKYQDCIDDIKSEIQEFIKKVPETKFNSQNIAHISLLIYEILTYFNILTLSEIKEILEYYSISTEQKFLNRCFFLLDKMDLIVEKFYMKTKYYSPKDSKQYVKLAFKPKSFIDKTKSAIDYFHFMEQKKDNPKYKALKAIKRNSLCI